MKQLVYSRLAVRARAAACLAFSTSVTACITTGIPVVTAADAPRIVPHAIFINNTGDGIRVRCTADAMPRCPSGFLEQLGLIADSIRRSPHKRILIRIHGGLNRLSSSFNASNAMLQRIAADSANRSAQVYPLFVNWESGLRSTYLEHLFYITQGQRYNTVGRKVVAPVYLAVDFGRGITRAMFTWGQQVMNFGRGFREGNREPFVANDDGIERSEGGYRPTRRQQALFFTRAIVLLPVKAVGVVLADALGTPAWDNMHRRTKLLFRDPNEFKNAKQRATARCARLRTTACDKESFEPASGAVAVLMDTIQAIMRADTSIAVILIGHSMGAIVADEIVRTRDSVRFDDIVFMAAASSLRDLEIAVVPYLARHPKAEFYDLTLHPTADLREQTGGGWGPNGSLLEWLDGYLANPESDLDRVAGKYDNFREAEHTFPPGVRMRIHLKAFGYRDGLGCGARSEPYHHGGFNDVSVPFWREELWQPGMNACPTFDEKTQRWVTAR